ncbi:hypothetical protein FRC15_001940 [Serendipita sp. 397]|nr:hypothetical protein FRC15_001940 [Serendipita sp. 397]
MASLSVSSPSSPPSSPNPTRIPKPKGNKLVKSPERAKAIAPATNLTTPSTSSGRRISFGGTGRRSISSTGHSLDASSSPMALTQLSRSASVSTGSFFQPPSAQGVTNSASKHLSLPLGAPHGSRWVPGAPYMPISNTTSLSSVTPTSSFPNSPYETPLATPGGLIPPEGLLIPLQQREALLRAREQGRAMAMGMDGGNPSSSSHFDSLLEASGLMNANDGTRAGLDSSVSIASWSPSMHGASLSRNGSLSVSSAHGASLSNPNLSISPSIASGPSNASSSRLLQAGDLSLSASDTLSGQSLSAIDLTQTVGRSYQPPEVNNPLSAVDSGPPPRPRKSSIRSSLPSIRGFRNAFSFSRSTSTPTNPKEKSRSQSRERKEEPIASNDGLSANNSIDLSTSPMGTMNLQRSATTPTLSSSTLPRASVDTIQPGIPAYKVYSTLQASSPASATHLPASATRFGFVGRNMRHSMDSSTSQPRLGQIFGQPGDGREAIQAPYANGSRERVVMPMEVDPVPTYHHGRISPAYVGHGRTSPVPGVSVGVIGITGLMRPPGLDPHVELDERSVRTESGYGFGGLRVGSDGIILSPIEDNDTTECDDLGDDESHIRALLGDGTFEGEYESTIGHGSERTHEIAGSAILHDGSFAHSFPPQTSPNELGRQLSARAQPGHSGDMDVPAMSHIDTYAPTLQEQHAAQTRAPPILNTTLPASPTPRPPGLENYQPPENTNDGTNAARNDTSTIEKGLLGELTKQLRRVMEQQSTMSLSRMDSSISMQRRDPHTPSSVLRLESDPATPLHERPVDEWGRWNLEDLKGAVARMKELIEEQEKRPSGKGSSQSKSSISSLFSTPAVSSQIGREPEAPGSINVVRKESQSTSSATVPSTTLVTPTSPNDTASYPFPSSSQPLPDDGLTPIAPVSRGDRDGSLDLSALDPELVAMLSPNHMTAPPPNALLTSDVDDNKPAVAPQIMLDSQSISTPAPIVHSSKSSGPISNHEEREYQESTLGLASISMAPDMTIATVASDGFGTMRSDQSVEEILLHKRIQDQGSTRTPVESEVSYSVEDMSFEPVATSSPPRNNGPTHISHISSVSGTTSTTASSKRDERDSMVSGHSPVRRSNRVLSTILDSPVKSSPSKSPSNKLRKDRLPLPQFDVETYRSEGDVTSGKAPFRKLFSGRLAGSKNSPPDPPNRSQPNDHAHLGHGRRPSSRIGVDEYSQPERLRRVITVGGESPRGMSLDEPRSSRLSGRPSLDHHSTTQMRPSLELHLGPRTARAFAAAGVLDRTENDLLTRTSAWRSASVLGYRRDGIEREYGNTSGVRSLASSPVPLPGMLGPGPSRLLTIQNVHRGSDIRRDRAESESYARSLLGRHQDINRPIIGSSARPELSVASSPASATPARTTLSSSSSSVNPNMDIRGQRSTQEGQAEAHQAALQAQKERHELEKEAILTALSEAKKEAKREKAEKEELRQELGEMGSYVDELESKLGEALAQMRWMEKEINILKSAVGVGTGRSPRRDDLSSNRELNRPLVQGSSRTPDVQEGRPSFDFHPAPAASTPTRASAIIVRHQPPSPENGAGKLSIAGSPFNERRYGHHRISSDASSLGVPRMNQSMTMLLQENTYGDGLDATSLYSANDGSPPPSPTLVLGKKSTRLAAPTQFPTSSLAPNTLGDYTRQGNLQTPRNRKRASLAMETSPTTTTADYSIAPGSPGSLVLHPEDERHLGDLMSFMGTEDI